MVCSYLQIITIDETYSFVRVDQIHLLNNVYCNEHLGYSVLSVNKPTIIKGPVDVIVPADIIQTSTVKSVVRRVGIWKK